jgi:CrcB protein
VGPLGFVAVGIGAALGAWLRWWLGVRMNGLAAIPMGTLAANLVGGLLVGVAIGAFERLPDLSTEARLLIVTGFLGGLTTFSSFSAEVVSFFGRSQYGLAIATIGLHLIGSLALTAVGIAVVRALSQ